MDLLRQRRSAGTEPVRLRLTTKIVIATSSVVVLAAGTVCAASPALAKCQPGRSNNGSVYFDGWVRSGSVGGVYSDMLNYSPWVQPNNQVLAWTMLNNGTSNWAQVGWWEYAGGTRYTFVQWTTSPNRWQTKFWNPQSTGAYTYYTTLYNNQPGKFSFQVSGSTIDAENASFTPNQAQNLGEIQTLADQMPGGYNNNEVFKSTNVYIGGWQAFSGSNYNSNGSYFGLNSVSSTQRNIWDWACSS